MSLTGRVNRLVNSLTVLSVDTGISEDFNFNKSFVMCSECDALLHIDGTGNLIPAQRISAWRCAPCLKIVIPCARNSNAALGVQI